ncbi:MAG: radical SAM protein [Oscillospiraceae bacterium]|nr:radical SAM protein [Oscillospiraceae bacterium]
MKTCYLIGKIAALGENRILHCCSSTVYLGAPVACEFSYGDDFPLEAYKRSVLELHKLNNSDSPPCGGCAHLIETPDETIPEFTYFTSIVIGCNLCNFSCIYCSYKNGDYEQGKKERASIKPTLQNMLDLGIINNNTLVDWGGGEVTVNKSCHEVVQFLVENGLFQNINTNASVFSADLEKALKIKKTSMQISVDSGTAPVFKKVKGRDCHEQVWENIKKYCNANSDLVTIKYIVLPENWDTGEFEAFVKNCVCSGVKNVRITAEYKAFYNGVYEDMLRKMAELLSISYANGLNVYVDKVQFNEKQLAYYNSLAIPSIIKRIEDTQGELQNAKNQVFALQKSISWKITKPLRSARRLFAKGK